MIGSRDGLVAPRLQRVAKASTIDDVAELPKSGAAMRMSASGLEAGIPEPDEGKLLTTER
jgi:hypothetical protein